MRFRDLNNWKNTGNLGGMIFFVQKLEELLFDYSLDTYKPSALNSPFLCREALFLINEINNNIIDKQNLSYILDELKWAIQNDPIAKKMLDFETSKYVLDNADTPLSEIKIRLEVLSKTLEPHKYIEKSIELLTKAIKETKKNDINQYSNLLITCILNLGASKESLYKKTVDYFFTEEVSSTDCLDDFFKDIYPYRHSYTVYFKVSKLINNVSDSIKNFKIEIIDNLPPEVPSKFSELFSPTTKHELVKVEDVSAVDSYSARISAEEYLDKVSNLFTLFYHKNQISWHEKALVLCNCCDPDDIKLIGEPKSAMEKGFDLKPTVASKELNFLINNLHLNNDGNFEKFDRIVDLHGICASSNIPENQLLNIWVALEMVTPSHPSSSKINTVINMMTPFLMNSYVKRIIDRLARDLILWNKNIVRSLLKKVPNTEGLSLANKILHFISLDENEELRKELYEELGSFHLLRYRVFQLSEVFSNTEKLSNMLSSHSKKVSWQIRRIYRTRNMIVHAGTSPTFISTLIENGHDYLDQILLEIMNLSCKDYEISSFDQAFELAKLEYERFSTILASIDNFSDENINRLYKRMDT